MRSEPVLLHDELQLFLSTIRTGDAEILADYVLKADKKLVDILQRVLQIELEQLLKSLCEKDGQFGETGLFCLMNALDRNCVSTYSLVRIINQLISLCKTPEQVTQLLQGLSEKNSAGETGLYWLMSALSSETHMIPEFTIKISKIISQLIAACNAPEQVTLLLQGLSQKSNAGQTGLYWLMKTLYETGNNLECSNEILKTISQLISACNTLEQVTLLLQGLSQENNAGRTGLYWLINRLTWSCVNNSALTIEILKPINQLISVSNTSEQVTQLLANRGKVTLFYLIEALNYAAQKNSEFTIEILKPINQLIVKYKTHEEVTLLLKVLSLKIYHSIGETKLSYLMRALSFSAKNNHAHAIEISKTINLLIECYFTNQNNFSEKTTMDAFISDMIGSKLIDTKEIYKSIFQGLEKNKAVVSPECMISMKKEFRYHLRDFLETADLKTLLSIMNDHSVLKSLIICRTDGKSAEKKSGTENLIQERIKKIIVEKCSTVNFDKILKELRPASRGWGLFRVDKGVDQNKEDLIHWIDNLSDLTLLESIENKDEKAFPFELSDEIKKIIGVIREACPRQAEDFVLGTSLKASSSDGSVEEPVAFSDEVVGEVVRLGYEEPQSESVEKIKVIPEDCLRQTEGLVTVPLKNSSSESSVEECAVSDPAEMDPFGLFREESYIPPQPQIKKTDLSENLLDFPPPSYDEVMQSNLLPPPSYEEVMRLKSDECNEAFQHKEVSVKSADIIPNQQQLTSLVAFFAPATDVEPKKVVSQKSSIDDFFQLLTGANVPSTPLPALKGQLESDIETDEVKMIAY